MSNFTIKDIENLSGIKAHTIRIWEQRYSFLKPKRTCTNIRYYCNEELKNLLDIALLNKYGVKISHIDCMNCNEISLKISSFKDELQQQEFRVNELIKKMIDLDVHCFEKIINDYIDAVGFEKTILELIFPYLEKIGLLWQSGRIRAVQEHLVSNIVRQKLIAGIESAAPDKKLDKTFLLFLPEGEHYEMGLLCTYYLLKNRGASVIYLGANVPMKDLEYIIGHKNPDVIYTHLTSPISNLQFERLLKNLSRIPSESIVISGWATKHYKKKLPANIGFKTSLSQVMDYLSAI